MGPTKGNRTLFGIAHVCCHLGEISASTANGLNKPDLKNRKIQALNRRCEITYKERYNNYSSFSVPLPGAPALRTENESDQSANCKHLALTPVMLICKKGFMMFHLLVH